MFKKKFFFKLSIQVEIFSYNWPIDPTTMDECLQEWNTKVEISFIIIYKEFFFLEG
jgi:hypothetical protein